MPIHKHPIPCRFKCEHFSYNEGIKYVQESLDYLSSVTNHLDQDLLPTFKLVPQFQYLFYGYYNEL